MEMKLLFKYDLKEKVYIKDLEKHGRVEQIVISGGFIAGQTQRTIEYIVSYWKDGKINTAQLDETEID